MPSSISVAIIESDPYVRSQLAEIIASFMDVRTRMATDDFEEGIRFIRENQPDVVILEVREIGEGAKQTAQILSHSPQTSVFVSCAEKNPDWILGLVRAGAREYLSRPLNPKELTDALKKISKPHGMKLMQPGRKGTAVAVYNPSGGMGTTTISVNLAAALAARGENVALVDLNLFSADVAAFLDLAPRYDVAHVTAKAGQMDGSFLRSVMIRHGSGIDVLAGAVDLGHADRVKPEQVKEMLAMLKANYTYIVVDAGGQLYGVNQALFSCCDRILFNTVLNLPNLKNAQRYLTAMHDEGFGADRVKLVINRFNPRDEIKTADAEKVLKTKVVAAIPNTYADVKASINKGEPLLVLSPRAPAARAIGELATTLFEQNGMEKEAVKGVVQHGIFRVFSF